LIVLLGRVAISFFAVAFRTAGIPAGAFALALRSCAAGLWPALLLLSSAGFSLRQRKNMPRSPTLTQIGTSFFRAYE
jgi:hypothetical protein